MNGFDDYDTQVHSDEIYDYDDLAHDEDTGSPIDTDRMERESRWMDDLSDDGDALASAGFGTDEDYGYFGDE